MSDKKTVKSAEKKSRPPKCIVCKKRSLTNLKCKCKKTTCLTHRHADSHKCSFDWFANAKKQLTKSLVKSEAVKLIRV